MAKTSLYLVIAVINAHASILHASRNSTSISSVSEHAKVASDSVNNDVPTRLGNQGIVPLERAATRKYTSVARENLGVPGGADSSDASSWGPASAAGYVLGTAVVCAFVLIVASTVLKNSGKPLPGSLEELKDRLVVPKYGTKADKLAEMAMESPLVQQALTALDMGTSSKKDKSPCTEMQAAAGTEFDEAVDSVQAALARANGVLHCSELLQDDFDPNEPSEPGPLIRPEEIVGGDQLLDTAADDDLFNRAEDMFNCKAAPEDDAFGEPIVNFERVSASFQDDDDDEVTL